MALLLFKKKHRNLAQAAIVRNAFLLTRVENIHVRFFSFNKRFAQTLPYMLCFGYVFTKHLAAKGYKDGKTFPWY